MADRVPSDHPSIDTVRGTLAETPAGIRIELPDDDRDSFPVGEVVRIVRDGDERFAAIERALTGEAVIPGIYDSPRFAREPGSGADRLPAWADDHGIRAGGSVLVDVVEPGFLYGLRGPGESAVYTAREPPSASLSAIAADLEERD